MFVVLMGPVLAGACGSRPAGVWSPVVPPPTLDLVVLHTNDNWGETRPCG